MRLIVAGVIPILLVVLFASGAGAHHGWSQYNTDQTVDLNGRIREAMFEHPHATLKLEVEKKTWTIILPPPTRAARLGLTVETLKADVQVGIAGHRHRTAEDEVRALRITLNGKTIPLR